MSGKRKISLHEKEQKLLKRIEQAKIELDKLQKRRRHEIGQLACKHGLDKLDNVRLDQLFNQLAIEHTA